MLRRHDLLFDLILVLHLLPVVLILIVDAHLINSMLLLLEAILAAYDNRWGLVILENTLDLGQEFLHALNLPVHRLLVMLRVEELGAALEQVLRACFVSRHRNCLLHSSIFVVWYLVEATILPG